MVLVLQGLVQRAELNGAVVAMTRVLGERIEVQLADGTRIAVKAQCVKELPVEATSDDEGSEGSDGMPLSSLVPSGSAGSQGAQLTVGGAPPTAHAAMALAPKDMVQKWSAETPFTRKRLGRGGATKTMYQSCTVVNVEGRLYGLAVTSDARGAQGQCEENALKLGLAVGGTADMMRAAMKHLTPEQQRQLDRLLKIRARTTSESGAYAGEQANARRLLDQKLQQQDLEQYKQLLEENIDASRATNYGASAWDGGTACNMAMVSFLGEGQHTDFFSRLLNFVTKAHCVQGVTGKRSWGGARCVALGFIGRLPVVLDSALLCITAADLAFSYVQRFGRSQRQERLSGFMAGVDAGLPTARGEESLRAYQEAERAGRDWFGVRAGRSKKPVKRQGAAFENARAAGADQRGKVRKTKALEGI